MSEISNIMDRLPIGEKSGKEVMSLLKIMIVDDEEDIHSVIKLALNHFLFDGSKLTFIHAYSAAEARELLEAHPDIVLVFLDVVMESNQAGLEIIQYIRNELNNFLIRIILVTGQPGQVPRDKIIRDYDINDYKEKGELTVEKLDITLYASLRAYKNLRIIEEYRERLELRVIEQSDILREKDNLFRLIFEAGRDAILLVDEKSRLVAAANPATLQMYGFESATEIIGKPLFDIISKCKDDPDYLKLKKSNGGINIEWHKRKNDETFPVEFSTGKFIYKDRQMTCIIIRDISNYKNNLKKQAEYLNQINSLFTDMQKLSLFLYNQEDEVEFGKSIREYGISRQEENVIYFLSRGLSNKEIGEKLFIHEYTVKKHVSSAFKKLNITSRAKLISFLKENNVQLEKRL